MELYINLLIKWHDKPEGQEIERLLWMPDSGDSLVFIRLNDPVALPFEHSRSELESALDRGEFHSLDMDPYAFLQKQEGSIPESHRKRRDEAWQAIKSLVEPADPRMFQSKLRGPIVQKIVQTAGKTKTMIYNYLRRFWQCGQTKNALLPRYVFCGAKGKDRAFSKQIKRGRPSSINNKSHGINIGPKERVYFRQGVKKFYDKRNGAHKPTLRQAYELTIEKYFSRGVKICDNGVQVPLLPPTSELPSFRQFQYYHEKDRDVKATLLAREGEKRFNLKHRAILGESTSMAFGPCSLFQIDSTIADVNLINSFGGGEIGRPVLYLVVDVFTRLIAGFALTLENSSYLAATLALENAATDKVSYCKRFGIDITPDDWPSQHVPEALLADRGEMLGQKADNLVSGLNIKLSNTPPYRADMKGIVERSFRSMNDGVIHWLPGASNPKPTRGDPDPRLNAKLTMDGFRKCLIACIIQHNSRFRDKYPFSGFLIRDRVNPIPIDLWKWGVINRSGHLRKMDQAILRRQLLLTGQASVTGRGILFNGVAYTCERALNEQWFVLARARKSWKMEISYDPRCIDEIYTWDNGKFETLRLVERDKMFAGLALEEVDAFHKRRKKDREAARNDEQQNAAKYRAIVKSTVYGANQPKPMSGHETKRARLSNIRQNRQAERDYERKRNKSPTQFVGSPDPTNVIPIESTQTDLRHHSPEWEKIFQESQSETD